MAHYGRALLLLATVATGRRVLTTPFSRTQLREARAARRPDRPRLPPVPEPSDKLEDPLLPPSSSAALPSPCLKLITSPDGRFAFVGDTPLPPDTCMGGYYGNDFLDPEVVCREGLPARGEDWDLLRHAMEATGGKGSAFRGTTKVVVDPGGGSGAALWADEGGVVFELANVPTWDVNKALEGRSENRRQRARSETPLWLQHLRCRERARRASVRAAAAHQAFRARRCVGVGYALRTADRMGREPSLRAELLQPQHLRVRRMISD
jgi:hypothetical protein